MVIYHLMIEDILISITVSVAVSRISGRQSIDPSTHCSRTLIDRLSYFCYPFLKQFANDYYDDMDAIKNLDNCLN